MTTENKQTETWVGAAWSADVVPVRAAALSGYRTCNALTVQAASQAEAHDMIRLWHDLHELLDDIIELTGHDICGDCECSEWDRKAKRIIRQAILAIERRETRR